MDGLQGAAPLILIVPSLIALFFVVRWLANHSDERYGYPVFLNWINLLPLAGWGGFGWLALKQAHPAPSMFLVPALCVALALAYNVRRTSVALGLLITLLQIAAVLPLAVFVMVYVLPVGALLLLAKITGPRQFDLMSPDTPTGRRSERIYAQMREQAKHRRHRH